MYNIIFLLLRAGFLTAMLSEIAFLTVFPDDQPSGMSLDTGTRQPSRTAVRKTFLSAGRQE
jgi:hypothetical protein